jgi:hypothetical protein
MKVTRHEMKAGGQKKERIKEPRDKDTRRRKQEKV